MMSDEGKFTNIANFPPLPSNRKKTDKGGGGDHTGGNPPGDDHLEARIAAIEKALPEIKERLVAVSVKVDSIEKHSATKADLTSTELNLIKWYVATAFAMTGLASAITFGLTRLLSH